MNLLVVDNEGREHLFKVSDERSVVHLSPVEPEDVPLDVTEFLYETFDGMVLDWPHNLCGDPVV